MHNAAITKQNDKQKVTSKPNQLIEFKVVLDYCLFSMKALYFQYNFHYLTKM